MNVKFVFHDCVMSLPHFPLGSTSPEQHEAFKCYLISIAIRRRRTPTRESDRYRTAVKLVQLLRKAGVVCELWDGKRMDSVAVFLFCLGLPFLDRGESLVSAVFIANRSFERKASRQRFHLAGVFNLNVQINKGRQMDLHHCSLLLN